jgi:hypothetical protein
MRNMREVTTAKTILVHDPLMDAMAAAVARIEEKVDRLLADTAESADGHLVIHIGPVSEQKE